MIDKLQWTKEFLSQLSLPVDPLSIKKYHRLWWANTRSQNRNSFRLTEIGYNMLTDKLSLIKYSIDVPEDIEWTNQVLLNLDKFLESPYYIFKNTIVVFREKTAVELILFGGDLQKFGKAKAQSKLNSEKNA